MITRCPGHACPLRADCQRWTLPVHGRTDFFGTTPFDHSHGGCAYFLSNLPRDEDVRLVAYHHWLREGRPAGRAAAHWAAAWRELAEAMGRPRDQEETPT